MVFDATKYGFQQTLVLDQPLNQQQIMVLDSNGCQVCLVSLTVDL